MISIDLQGIWELYLDAEKLHTQPPKGNDTIVLPDSTSHAKKGTENLEPDMDHMTDRFYFEGYAWYSRKISVEENWVEKKLTLFLERTRISTVYIDGEEISTENSLCGFHRHDLTGRLTKGEHILTIRVNNTEYPTRGGHMTSPDTQTNWNGILGRVELQIREACYPENLQITAENPEEIQVSAEICGAKEGRAGVTICRMNGEILQEQEYAFADGKLEAVLALDGENLLWDEYHTNVLQAKISVGKETLIQRFGIRKLSREGRRLFVNDKQVFLRGKHDGLVFPKTGYAPMTVEEWKKVFATAKEYGINHYRFHTCCPPDAAFTAADEMGIYMEPELPFWGTIAAPGEEGYKEEEQNYLIEEGYRILKDFGNHPSFIMLSMGNELWGSRERINGFLRDYKRVDKRHFYTQGSNNFQFCPVVLEEEDVFCGVRLAQGRLFRGSYAMCDAPQGHIQTMAPNSAHNYDDVIAPLQELSAENAGQADIEIQYGTGTRKVKAVSVEQALLPQIPIVSHEIGQYDFFPDFTELQRYEGSIQPLYLNIYRERMEKSGVYKQWKQFYQATGALAIDCYRREIEAALRTSELSGFQLLDLQDFPGQCVALVGVLNAWMDSKGLVTPKEWRRFCSETVVLAELDSFVVTEKQEIRMPVKLSVCNWDSFEGKEVLCRVTLDHQVIAMEVLPIVKGRERLQEVGMITYTIPSMEKPAMVKVELKVMDTEYQNEYTLWAYPKYSVTISETEINDNGRVLFLARSSEEVTTYQTKKLPFVYIPQPEENDVEGTYCTDFWNYPMFRSISESMNRKVPIGTLGLYIDNKNAVLQGFPCENYSTPQWYQLVTHSHCAVLDGRDDIDIIVQPIDNVERCHKLGMLYFQKNVMVCTSRLWEIAEYPEVQAFAKALVDVFL